MSEISRRQIVIGAAAAAAVAALPTVVAAAAPAARVVDPEIECLRIWVDRLFAELRAMGYAVRKPPGRAGGALIFWLQDDDDLTSMQMVELTEDVFL